jgi:hypothetical protein
LAEPLEVSLREPDVFSAMSQSLGRWAWIAANNNLKNRKKKKNIAAMGSVH